VFRAQCLCKLGSRTDDAAVVSTAAMRMAKVTATYIDGDVNCWRLGLLGAL